MKYCKSCNLKIRDDRKNCPLCQSLLINKTNTTIENIFPTILLKEKTNDFIVKILIFISVISIIACITINIMVPTNIYWSIIVVASIISLWITGFIALGKRKTVIKNVFYQTMIISVLSILWDYFTGYHAWAVTYVIPFVFVAGIWTITAMRFILKKYIQYHFCVFSYVFFGLIPGIFLWADIVTVKYPAIICFLTSSIVLFEMIIFEGRIFFSELKKKFHI